MKKISQYIIFTILLLSIFAACDSAINDDPRPQTESAPSSRLSELLGASDVAGYSMADRPRRFDFPADHGAHPGYRNEWWYLTGNLDAASGGRFGYELTLFRFSLTPGNERSTASNWETNQVWVGHFAITDVNAGKFHVGQRYSRGAAGLAGATDTPVHVWLDDWSIKSPDGGTSWQLQALERDVELSLTLEAAKQVVLNGTNGLSQKSARPGNASYYYSIPRLATSGEIRVDGETKRVSGLSWLDREWGSSALSRDQVGWDWFALQLSDGTDLMFYTLRRLDGSADEHSSGTWIDANGRADHLQKSDVIIEVTGYWQNERGKSYPSGWQIVIPSKALSIRVSPVLDDQELVTNVRYWEGAVDVEGESGSGVVEGRGYVELTGYASE